MSRFCLSLFLLFYTSQAFAASSTGERIQVKGEIIDTWCYFSGVMGGPDAVVGTAHHTCAVWCSAGGIPVGLRADDGTIYMVLKIEGDTHSASGDTQLKLAAHTVEADGMFYMRDGLNYLVVNEIISDLGITQDTARDFGPVPGFAVPKADQ